MITRGTDYAIRLLRGLADGEIHTVTELTGKEMVPRPFAYKILKRLSKAGLVEILRGTDGGCRLAADLTRVNLYGLMTAIGDDCRIAGCTGDGFDCPWRAEHGGCTVHCCLAKIQAALKKELQAYSLAELLHQAGETSAM